jgi:menaquinone-9 beta-reductase
MYDLLIIGGGPAGSSAAITAARLGAQVLLLERGRFPRQKVCGEFISAESLDLLRGLLGLRHEALLRDAVRIHGARVFLDGRRIETAVDPAAASVARFDLDLALWNAAMELRVDARQQVAVQSVNGIGPFRVASTASEFDCRAVLNASGRWSNLTSDPAFLPTAKWIGVKAHFEEPDAQPSTDLYFFEGGYCGVQPVGFVNGNSRINACAMVRADTANTLNEVLVQHPALEERAQSWKPLFDAVSTSPLVFRKPEAVRDGLPMAGDAAGFVDPFVGDGISLALRSGALAAECLRPAFGGAISLQSAVERYREEYQRQLAPVFRASSAIRRLLQLPRTVRRPLISLVNASPKIAQLMISATR